MAVKKSELYSSLWASCDELRGGMDASQYKNYVLVLLFIKYVSDKYAGQKYAPITVPKGTSFADMVAFKGKSDIGDQINKRIIAEGSPFEVLTPANLEATYGAPMEILEHGGMPLVIDRAIVPRREIG